MTIKCGLNRAKSETCLYFRHVKGSFLLVLTEVDDLVYTGHQDLITEFEKHLQHTWKIQECGDLRSFLGINIVYNRIKGTVTFDVAEKIKAIFDALTRISNYSNYSNYSN